MLHWFMMLPFLFNRKGMTRIGSYIKWESEIQVIWMYEKVDPLCPKVENVKSISIFCHCCFLLRFCLYSSRGLIVASNCRWQICSDKREKKSVKLSSSKYYMTAWMIMTQKLHTWGPCRRIEGWSFDRIYLLYLVHINGR